MDLSRALVLAILASFFLSFSPTLIAAQSRPARSASKAAVNHKITISKSFDKWSGDSSATAKTEIYGTSDPAFDVVGAYLACDRMASLCNSFSIIVRYYSKTNPSSRELQRWQYVGTGDFCFRYIIYDGTGSVSQRDAACRLQQGLSGRDNRGRLFAINPVHVSEEMHDQLLRAAKVEVQIGSTELTLTSRFLKAYAALADTVRLTWSR